MSPDLQPPQKTSPPTSERRSAVHRFRGELSPGASGRLSELAAAVHHASVPMPPARRRRVLGGVAVAFLVAVIVGASLVFAEPLHHLCAASFRLGSGATTDRARFYRKELLEHAWTDLAERPDAQLAGARWFVDEPEPKMLRICLTTSDRPRGVDRATAIAQGFLARLSVLANEVRSKPTDSEDVLTGYAEVLQRRLGDAQSQLEAAMAALPFSDPRVDRDAMLARWNDLRAEFASARERLTEAAAGFEAMHAESAPTHGVVSAEERREAYLADAALQQDLKELGVTLTELKLHLLTVWQKSSPPLEQAGEATDALVDRLSRRGSEELPAEFRGAVEKFLEEGAAYRDERRVFAQAWTAQFTWLQQREVDPQNADILDFYQRARSLLNDFLYSGSQRLSAMRTQINAIAKNPSDSARRHVFQSDLSRDFQELQAVHHRFEFAAGSIETPENFRLDSALRIARGLRRRSTEAMQVIENRLQALAAERTRRQREEAMASLEAVLQTTRSASDRTVEELLAIQENLNRSANLSEAFVAAVLRAELANHRLQMTREDLDRTENQLKELAVRRAAEEPGSDISLVSCGVVKTAVDLPERLRFGGVGAGVAFCAALFGQFLLRRRS